MRSGFKLVLMTLPLMAAGVGFVAWTISTKPAPAQEAIAERAVAVRYITARETSLRPTATGFGLVAPARTFEAIAQVTGTAEYVNPALKKGEILPAGTELVRLADSDYTLAIAQARANIRAAEAKLAEIAVSEDNLKAALEIEEQTLAIREAEMQRLEQLYDAGTASQVARDNGKAAWLAQLQKVRGQKNSLALLPTQREVQQQQIAVYQASLATAELNLARTRLTLPFAARVGNVAVEIGQLVRSGQVVASFDGIQAAEVEAQISATDLRSLFRQFATGTDSFALDPSAITQQLDGSISAIVRLRLGDDMVEWPATVDRFSNSIDPKTGTIGVIVRVENAYGGAEPGARPPLTKGMFVEVNLAAAPQPGILIPRAALRGNEVLVADAHDRLRLVPVTVDLLQGDLALIRSGLAANARVLISTPVPLIDGLLLNPQADDAFDQRLVRAGAEK